MSSRRPILLWVLLAGPMLASLACGDRPSLGRSRETPAVVVDKQPANFASRRFDPANPPADMPPLAPGEEAQCDSNFLSNVSVGGETRQADATHAWVTIAQIHVTLQLNITIWAPANVTPHVMEHEEGHRQIAEHYYETAGELVRRIASAHTGEKIEVTGTDLGAESTKLFQQVANEIADKYNTELNPKPAQLLYDSITDHGRNEVVVKDAVASAIKNALAESPLPVSHPGD